MKRNGGGDNKAIIGLMSTPDHHNKDIIGTLFDLLRTVAVTLDHYSCRIITSEHSTNRPAKLSATI